jgi:hypothetical protein
MITDKHHTINDNIRRLVSELNIVLGEAFENNMEVEMDIETIYGPLGGRLHLTPTVRVRLGK